MTMHQEVMNWMSIHPLRVDFIVFAVVAGSIAYILGRSRSRRRVLHRKVRGMYKKRVDIERFHLMRFEDAITDACMEMVHRGEMTEAQEKMYYEWFSTLRRGRQGLCLIPGRSQEATKKGIRARLKKFYNKK